MQTSIHNLTLPPYIKGPISSCFGNERWHWRWIVSCRAVQYEHNFSDAGLRFKALKRVSQKKHSICEQWGPTWTSFSVDVQCWLLHFLASLFSLLWSWLGSVGKSDVTYFFVPIRVLQHQYLNVKIVVDFFVYVASTVDKMYSDHTTPFFPQNRKNWNIKGARQTISGRVASWVM